MIMEVISLYVGEFSFETFLCPGAGLETVQYIKKLFPVFEGNHQRKFGLPSILQTGSSLVKFSDEVSALHFLLLIFLEFESLQVQSFTEVLIGNFIPSSNRMNRFY